MAALGDRELPQARDRHALALVLVDAADDDGAAIGPEQGHDLLEPLLAVFEVDRIHDRLALAVAQGHLEHPRVGRVDHERHLHLAGDLGHEPVDVGGLVAVGVGQADVENVGAGANLGAPDLGRLLELVGDDQLLEPSGADDVRALAHEQRAVVLGRVEHLDPADRLLLVRRRDARRTAVDQRLDRGDVGRRRPAAAADEVDPAFIDEALQLEGQAPGRLRVLAALVGQAGVGVDAHEACRHRGQRTEVVGHELGPGRAVEADRQEVEVLERRVERLDALARQHRAHRLDRPADHQRQRDARALHRRAHADRRRLEVQRVLGCLEQQRVHAPGDERGGLKLVRLPDLIEGDVARDADRARRRSHRADDEAGAGGLAGQPRSGERDLVGAPGQAVLAEHVRRAPEGVRRDHVRAGVEVGGVDASDDVGAREVQVLVTAFVLGAAEVLGAESRRLDHGAHRTVEDEDALGQRVPEKRHGVIVAHMTSTALSLDGVRILDLSRVLAGPFCGMLLADLGADVIKIEDTGAGDESRTWPPHKDGESAAYLVINRNKRDLTLDLKSPDGVAVLKKLVAGADVLIENFRTGTMESFGLGYDTLSAINPGLIYCSVSAFGRTGPRNDGAGYEALMQAFSGIMSITGEPDGPPVRAGVSFLDLTTGIFSAFGIVNALLYRAKTGLGQRVDGSLLETAVTLLNYHAEGYLLTGAVPKPLGSAHPSLSPYRTFRCRDGRSWWGRSTSPRYATSASRPTSGEPGIAPSWRRRSPRRSGPSTASRC